MDQLRHRCQADESAFYELGEVTYTTKGPYTFIDRGADVLGVAHLDSVSYDKAFTVVKIPPSEVVVFSRAHDDRLGVYVLLDLLPQMGIECDVLLTTGEETGQSTGQFFEVPEGKDYNWMFQFDRAGTDVVCYQYECADLTKRLEKAGFYVADGLFSDISDMDYLGIKGFNVGTAYYHNHSNGSHALMSELTYMLLMFAKFYSMFKDEKLEHTYVAYDNGRYSNYYGWGAYDSFRWNNNDVSSGHDDSEMDWEAYKAFYEELRVDGLGHEEAHPLAKEMGHLEWEKQVYESKRRNNRHSTSIVVYEENHVDDGEWCPQCGLWIPYEDDDTLLDTGLCYVCYQEWLGFEFEDRNQVKRVHEHTDHEWHQLQTANLKEGNDEN